MRHYADGDLFDASSWGYHVSIAPGFISGALTFRTTSLTPNSTPRRLVSVLKTAMTNRPLLKKMLALKSSVSKPASWR
jgi:hypothetical protein